jgi:hypothetical protein
MDFVDAAGALFQLNGKRLTLEGREYWKPILTSMARERRTVLACGRQVEKTTNLLKLLLYRSAKVAGNSCLYVAPRQDQFYTMERSRLQPLLKGSSFFAKILLDQRTQRIKHRCFRNNSQVVLAAALESADPVRGVSANDLLLDEYQDLCPDLLAVAEECQSHAENPHTIIAGTSKFADNPLEQAFALSTACLWTVACAGCGADVTADGRIILPQGYGCPHCTHALDLRSGRWVPANPGSTWAAGYRIPQMLGPWMTHAQILEKERTYEAPVFRNEVLGEAVNLGDLVFDLRLLHALCEPRPMAGRLADLPAVARPRLVAGVDWGHTASSGTVLVIGALLPDYIFRVFHWSRWKPGQDPQQLAREVADRCRLLGATVIGADGVGHGHVMNALLLGRFQGPVSLTAVCYTDGSGSSFTSETSARFQLTIGKSRAIGGLLSRTNARQIFFPRREDAEAYLLEMSTERCRVNEKTGRLIYEKAAGNPDDALHALVYAVTTAQQAFFNQAVY